MSKRRRTTEEDDLEEIRKGFEMFDVNGTGIIDPDELLEVMDAMNLKEKNPFIYEIIESLNSEKEFKNKGGVSLEELVSYVYNKVNNTETNVGIRQIYDVINDRDTDTVPMSTFYTLARDYGDQLSEEEIRSLLEKTQMGGEELNFDEFYTIMKGSRRNNVNMSSNRSSYKKKMNEVYVKKGSNNASLNSGENSQRKRPIKNNYNYNYNYNYDQPKEPEQFQEKDYNEQQSLENNISDRYNQNNIEENIPIEKEINKEIKEEIKEKKEEQNDTPLNYSYKMVKIGAAPIVENHITVEENIINNVDNNLNINDIVDNSNNNDDNYTKVKETKIRNLPDGGKEIEITEKTEVKIERPIYRGNRYRFSRKAKEEDNNEDVKNESKPTYYRIRRPRGSEQSNKTDEQQVSGTKIEVEENKEVVIPKRYHRRYRDNKTSTNNDN